MEYLIKQTSSAWVSFSGGQENKETGSSRDRIILPQKTQSFKSVKKRVQDWFRRQLSRPMSQDFSSYNEIEQVAAVAAAAYAINSIQESTFPEIKRESSKRIPESQDSKVPVTVAPDEKAPEKPVRPSRSMKRTPTFADTKPESDAGTSVKKYPSFADKKSDDTNGMKPDSRPIADVPTIKPTAPVPKPDLPTTPKPATPTTETKRQRSTIADSWEREELAKINERYDELKAEILSWENKKKTKAKGRLNKTEKELEQRRLGAKELERKKLKAVSNFHSKIEYIEQIAAGARAQAEEKRRNDEFKVKDKANKIRATGKIPPTCLCF